MPATHILEAEAGRYVTTRQLVIEMLQARDWTVPDLAIALELNRNAVGSAIRKLHREGLCYIADYPPHYGTQGARAARWRWGQGTNAVRPKWSKKAAAASQRRYHEKHGSKLKVKRRAKRIGVDLGVFEGLI